MKSKRTKAVLRYAGRCALVLVTLLTATVIALYSIMYVLAKGPSPTARDLFVRSVMETSAAKFLARIYLSDEEIDLILKEDENLSGDKTDPSLIVIPGISENDPGSAGDDPGTTPGTTPGTSPDTTPDPSDTQPPTGGDTDKPTGGEDSDSKSEDDGIEIVEVSGDTYYGKLMIVRDPSRVSIGTIPKYGYDAGLSGMTLRKFIETTGSVAGINAGGFEDESGGGTGAVPDGIVIRDGEIIWGTAETFYKCVIGFDENHILHVGNMTGADALEQGIVSGISFAGGPVLVCNGVPETAKRKLGGGLNPRTAIGQRADGAVLLLVINGRQADSLGATFGDLVNIMVTHGAVNAANLDGGSSSLMMYNGEFLTQSAYFFGERKLPDVILVGAAK